MKSSMKPIAAFVLILLLAVTLEETGPRVAEGLFGKGKCRFPSKLFHGPCARDTNCDTVCKTEGYPAGNCHGLRRRCLCCRR